MYMTNGEKFSPSKNSQRKFINIDPSKKMYTEFKFQSTDPENRYFMEKIVNTGPGGGLQFRPKYSAKLSKKISEMKNTPFELYIDTRQLSQTHKVKFHFRPIDDDADRDEYEMLKVKLRHAKEHIISAYKKTKTYFTTKH